MNKDTQGPSVALFEADPEAKSALATSLALGSITDMAAFVGVFLAGGHGTMWDFPQNDELGSILGNAISHGKAVGAVCHGVAGLATDEIATALRGKISLWVFQRRRSRCGSYRGGSLSARNETYRCGRYL